MGLLDDLARQSAQKQAEEQQAEKEHEEREYRFRTKIRPAMARLYDYLKELCELLSYVKRPTTVHYQVPRYGRLTAQLDPDYRLTVSRDEGRVTIQLAVSAEIDGASAPVVTYEKRHILEEVEEYLHSYGLRTAVNQRFDLDDELVSANLVAHGKVHLKGCIVADVANDRISFEFTNFDQLGSSTKRLHLSAIDDAFLDQLGRYIAREDDTYLREAIDEQTLNALRSRLATDNKKRSSELQLAEALAQREQELAAASESENLIGRLKKLSSRLLRGT